MSQRAVWTRVEQKEELANPEYCFQSTSYENGNLGDAQRNIMNII